MLAATALATAMVGSATSSEAGGPPVATRLVYVGGPTPVQQAYTVRADGRGLAQLTFATEHVWDAEVSPNGRRLAFRRGASLVVADADGRRAAQVGEFAGAFAWAPDSRRLAFASGSRGGSAPAGFRSARRCTRRA